jgi:hypothetical protein
MVFGPVHLGRASWHQERVEGEFFSSGWTGTERGTGRDLGQDTPKDLLPLTCFLTRTHLLKFSPPPKIMPPIGDQVFNT